MERAIAKAKTPWLVLERESMDEVTDRARTLFPALGHCAFGVHPDARTGLEVNRFRRLTVFGKWHMDLPDQRVFVTREMMGL